MDDITWKMDDDLSLPMGNFIKPGVRRPMAGLCMVFLRWWSSGFFRNNCFLNIVETKPFTPLNSGYSLSNLGNRKVMQSAIN